MREADVFRVLKATLCTRPGEWALFPQVREATGFGDTGSRTADAIGVLCWPTAAEREGWLHGFEIKVARSDWLRELKQPEKSEPFRSRCHCWWIVATEGVVRDGELPDGWGLRVVDGDKARFVKRARMVPPAQPPDWPFIASLLRSASEGQPRYVKALEAIAAHAQALAASMDRLGALPVAEPVQLSIAEPRP